MPPKAPPHQLPERKPTGAVAGAVSTGDRRLSLVVIRDRIATELDHPMVSARDVALLSKQLVEVIREIDAIPNASEVSAVASIAARRESRRAAAGL